ncbi:MAG: ribosome silencing factor [Acidobacteriota bacterium]
MTLTSAPSTDEILAHLEQRRDDRPPSDLTSDEQARLAAAAAADKKAEELRVLDLSTVSDFTDRFLICSGNSERQVKAIADSISDALRRAKVKPLHIEGFNQGQWVLLDYGGHLVIHVFHRDVRGFYDLDRLWSDAPDLTESLGGAPDAPLQAAVRQSAETQSAEAADAAPAD